ncbi:MAG: GNAT family N-acetyltransferase [Streptococcaceae bacterium]|jgi:diamine N-acetyltransferase|nr:GNAT family N-acetyltransferase [Streptococcaceae bacterium]
MTKLRKIDAENYWECLNLKVAEQQSTFVAPNSVSLAEAWVFSEEARPFAIYSDDGQMIGFVMLACYPEKPEFVIWRFMIDQRFQGQGYGKSALQNTVDWLVQEYQPEKIYLSVEPENVGATGLYEKFGFEKTGEIEDGEAVMVLDLKK